MRRLALSAVLFTASPVYAGICPHRPTPTVDKAKLSEDDSLATLIYESQTSCRGRERADAFYRMAPFSVAQYPEVITAIIYGLQDSNEDVRFAAARRLLDIVTDEPTACSDGLRARLEPIEHDCDEAVADLISQTMRVCRL